MQSKFSKFHPIVNFLFFIVTIALSMFVMHPVFLATSLITSFIYSVMLNGKKALKFNAFIILPMALFSIAVNILFNHRGETVIGFLPQGSAITLESVTAGIATAVMIASVICWFSCYNVIMTSDKFIYIFGKRLPSVSLILSMVFRFVPRFKAQFKRTVTAQKCIGYDISEGRLSHRVKNLAKVTSVMTGWALENSIETADSMKSRGYGLKGRTSFSTYKFRKADRLAVCYVLATTVYIIAGIVKGGVEYSYYPIVNIQGGTAYSASIFAAFALLCSLPVIIEIQEDIKWKYLKSKI